jgi:hypothetical protein
MTTTLTDTDSPTAPPAPRGVRRRLPGALSLAAAAAAGALIAPTAASAAGSLVTISDSVTSSAARVSAGGRLQVENVNSTVLMYRTPVGATSWAAGTTKHFADVSTSGFSSIRVVSNVRTGSAANVTFRFTILEGTELVAQLSTYTLAPGTSRTLTIDVPARAVAIYGAAGAGSGSVASDVLVYGLR